MQISAIPSSLIRVKIARLSLSESISTKPIVNNKLENKLLSFILLNPFLIVYFHYNKFCRFNKIVILSLDYYGLVIQP